MARRTFFSFHYKPDNWRASQVRNIGAIEGNSPVKDNDWEKITKGGKAAIERWIQEQLKGRSCTIVLIGEQTAGRKWINYEIEQSWNLGKGLMGIYIHNLQNAAGEKSSKGDNPFDDFTIGDKKLSSIIHAYNPPFTSSTSVYNHIKENIADWVEDAIAIRDEYK